MFCFDYINLPVAPVNLIGPWHTPPKTLDQREAQTVTDLPTAKLRGKRPLY